MHTNSSVKVLLYTSKVLKSGEHPIMVRIIKERKPKYISIGHSCRKDQWDFSKQRPKKTHPNKQRLDIYIATKITEVEKELLDYEIKNKEFSLQQFTSHVKKDKRNKNVYTFIDKIDKEYRAAGKLGTADVYKQTKSMLQTFTGKAELFFSDITFSFLSKYEEFFRTKGTKEISISYYMRTLRAVYNKAMLDKLCDELSYPFNQYKISKFDTSTKKRAISKGDVEKIINKQYEEGSRLFHSKNYFLFSFYTRGINFTDMALLTWNNIQNGRVEYIRQKTGKPITMSLLEPAIEIIEYYKKHNIENNKYIFPILSDFHATPLQIKNRIHKVLGQTNEDLKDIAKDIGFPFKLTTYVARHTFATVLKRSGVSVAIIKETLGHKSERTTEIYLGAFDETDIDDAMKKLL